MTVLNPRSGTPTATSSPILDAFTNNRQFFALLQWNSRGVYANYENLQLLIKHFSPCCISLQELILGSRAHVSWPSDYTLLHTASRSWANGGTTLLVHKRILSNPFRICTSLQAVAASIHMNRCYTVYLLYEYLPPNTPVAHSELRLCLGNSLGPS